MNRTVQGFVAQISELARRAAFQTLESAFGERPARAAARGSASAAPPPAAGVGRPRGGKGTKRTQADIDALAERLVSFVKSNPGAPYRADQQGARDHDQGPRATDPQAGRRWLPALEGPEAFHDLHRRPEDLEELTSEVWRDPLQVSPRTPDGRCNTLRVRTARSNLRRDRAA
jgi:hypothetical protein